MWGDTMHGSMHGGGGGGGGGGGEGCSIDDSVPHLSDASGILFWDVFSQKFWEPLAAMPWMLQAPSWHPAQMTTQPGCGASLSPDFS